MKPELPSRHTEPQRQERRSRLRRLLGRTKTMTFRHQAATAVALGAIAAAAVGVSAQADTNAIAEFYKGKTITVHFGGGVGGSYWLYSQLAASHLGRFIPGNPNLVIQAMPGSGGIKGLNYSYNVAPRDGSFITMAH